MKLVIGQFNDSFPPVMDGVASVTKNYAYWLNKKYGQSYVITPKFPTYEDCEDFQVLRYFSLPLIPRPPYRLGVPRLDNSIKKTLEQIPFNLVHAHSPFSSGQLALRVARKKRIPIVATFHSKFYDDFKAVVKSHHLAQIGVRQVVKFFNTVDYVWTVNQASVETLRSYGYAGNVEVMPNGTDFQPLTDLPKALKLVNSQLKISKRELVFLFVGQHIWQKNLKLLVHSLKTLQEMKINFQMVFIGKGPAEDELKRLVHDLQLDTKVSFLGMITDRELLQAFFARADLFLFPSLYDTGGIVIQEAAAVKCPTIVIKNSNAAEQIRDNLNGYTAENNPQTFALRIKEIVSDRLQLEKVGANAQKTVCKNWPDIIATVEKRYQEIIQFHQKKEA